MPLRVGVPRSLFYHSEPGLLTAFLEAVGREPVLSPPTNRRILERGVSLAVDETCLPVKLHLGHVDSLVGKVDRVLVPRYASFSRHSDDTCVKFWAAADVTRNVFPGLEVIGYDVDATTGRDERSSLVRLARELGVDRRTSLRAWKVADKARKDTLEQAADEQRRLLESDSSKARILVVGHRYVIDDPLLGTPIISALEKQDVCVLRSDRIDDLAGARERAYEFSPTLKWTYNREQIGALVDLREQVDGVLMLITFPCGPDSLCAELCVRRIRERPIAVIVLDELSATGGLQTRIESFCDLVKMRVRS